MLTFYFVVGLQAIAEETKAIVEREEFEAAKKAMDTQTIAEDAQRDLGRYNQGVSSYFLEYFVIITSV